MLAFRSIAVEAARVVRRVVLKPGLPPDASVFAGDDDPATLHLGAFAAETLVGIATFIPAACPAGAGPQQWQLRGMATIAEVRNQGVGGELLEAGIARVREQGGVLVWCNGRSRACGFYERHGFVAQGAEFDLPHTGPHFLFVRQLPVS